MPAVIEYSMRTKPEFFEEVLDDYITFADEFGLVNPNEDLILVTADRHRQIIRGIGVFASATEAAEVGHAAMFDRFRATVADKLAEVPEREELELIHVFVKEVL
jgi:hypothetical protein